MIQTFYITVSLLFSIYILIELFRINILKKDNNVLIVGLLSLLSISFGLFLLIKYGLIIDYGKIDLQDMENAVFISKLGTFNTFIGLFSTGILIMKFMFFWIKKHMRP